MERRILLAFTLSFLVFVIYMRMMAPRPEDIPVQFPESPPASQPEPSLPIGETPGESVGEIPAVSPSVEPPIEADKREADSETPLVVETPLYRAVLSNRGANLRSFVLKKYENEEGELYEMVPQAASRRLELYPLDIDLDGGEQTARLKAALFQASKQRLTLNEGNSGDIVFNWADGRGVEVTKRLRFHGGSYVLDIEILAKLAGTEIRKRVLFGPGAGEESRTGTYAQADRGVVRVGEELRFYDAGDIEGGEGASMDVGAVGVSSHYFVGLMALAPGSGYGARLSSQSLESEDGNGGKRDFISAALEVPGSPARFQVFVGPKEHDRLASLGPGLEQVIDYGSWMRYLALPLRSALLWIHGYVGNYGWSIVLLTVLINIALIPLKHHSYVSMRKMQKLAPQVKRIQERYKKLKPTDPKQQEKNREVMALYKAHNVSPLSGCLPMLLMIPFFFAFYRLLMVSIELRHAPFMLWIQDLSTNDPYFVLPILMGATQIAVQKMSPQTSADPMQAKIMMLMPIMFVFILAWAPAGLVLYWFVNNLVSIGQQTITNRLLDDETPSSEPAKTGGGKARKSKKKSVSRS